jgi:hypothetical protein
METSASYEARSAPLPYPTDVQPGPTATGIDLKDERKAEPTGGRSIWRMSQ